MALSDLPCFLLYTGWRRAQALYRPVLEGHNPQRIYILELLRTEPMTVGEIAAALELDMPSASGILRRMEGDGLISRSRSFDNQTLVHCSITKAGSALQRQLAEGIEAIDQRVLKEIGQADVEALRRIIDVISSLKDF